MRVRSLTNPIDVHDSMIPWVVSAWELLLGNATDLGQGVLVIDEEYGHQGPTTAEYLYEDTGGPVHQPGGGEQFPWDHATCTRC